MGRAGEADGRAAVARAAATQHHSAGRDREGAGELVSARAEHHGASTGAAGIVEGSLDAGGVVTVHRLYGFSDTDRG